MLGQFKRSKTQAVTARRCSTLKNSLARNTIIKIIVRVVLLVGLNKGGNMGLLDFIFGKDPEWVEVSKDTFSNVIW